MSPSSVLPKGGTAQESPSVPLLSLVTLSTSICFFPAPGSSPGSAVGTVQAGLGSPVSVPRLTTAQTEVEAAIDAVHYPEKYHYPVCCPLQISLWNIYE